MSLGCFQSDMHKIVGLAERVKFLIPSRPVVVDPKVWRWRSRSTMMFESASVGGTVLK